MVNLKMNIKITINGLFQSVNLLIFIIQLNDFNEFGRTF